MSMRARRSLGEGGSKNKIKIERKREIKRKS
jgi:hypothetical protein